MGYELFIYAIVMIIISYGMMMIMAPKPEKPVAGQLDIPTAEQGGNVPVCFGENVMKQSNVIWYGNASTIPIKSGGGKK